MFRFAKKRVQATRKIVNNRMKERKTIKSMLNKVHTTHIIKTRAVDYEDAQMRARVCMKKWWVPQDNINMHSKMNVCLLIFGAFAHHSRSLLRMGLIRFDHIVCHARLFVCIFVHYCQFLPFLNLYLFVAADAAAAADEDRTSVSFAFHFISFHFTSHSNRWVLIMRVICTKRQMVWLISKFDSESPHCHLTGWQSKNYCLFIFIYTYLSKSKCSVRCTM